MRPVRRWLAWMAVAGVLVGVGTAGVLALTPVGHAPLHIGCTHHNHGPTRTAGEGKRLFDARALNRQSRQLPP